MTVNTIKNILEYKGLCEDISNIILNEYLYKKRPFIDELSKQNINRILKEDLYFNPYNKEKAFYNDIYMITQIQRTKTMSQRKFMEIYDDCEIFVDEILMENNIFIEMMDASLNEKINRIMKL
jgi:hypothetical protein